MYVCPDCKGDLEKLRCKWCQSEYSCIDSIPILFSKDPRFQSVLEISGIYDTIYRNEHNVWEKQGRTREFIDYFSSLVNQFPGFASFPRRLVAMEILPSGRVAKAMYTSQVKPYEWTTSGCSLRITVRTLGKFLRKAVRPCWQSRS